MRALRNRMGRQFAKMEKEAQVTEEEGAPGDRGLDRLAGGQGELVAKESLPSVLDNDVRMVFENGKHLLAGRDAFALNDPAIGLVVYLPG